MEMQDKYDTAFLGIIQNEGNIGGFLDSVFSFLYRRTDFYQHINEEKTRGFPPGVAAKIVYQHFKKYNDKADELREKARERMLRMEEKMKQAQQTPPVAQEVEVGDDTEKTEKSPETSEPQAEASAAPEVNGAAEAEPTKEAEEPKAEEPKAEEPKQEEAMECEPKKEQEEEKKDEKSEDKSEDKKESKDDDVDPDDDPELTKMQRIYQANPDSYNGAIRDKYSWGQEITEVDARIKIPQHITKAKQCRVVISKKHLKVCVQPPPGESGGSGEWVSLIDEDLAWEVKVDDSMWTLVNDVPRPGQEKQTNIHINLEKVQERWWDCLLAGEPKISVRKIDPSRPMTDLDDEAQAKLEEMMWNERQKALGLPQSGQLKMEGMLRQAWDADGSPFKGQPFDLSKVNISGDGNSMSFNNPPPSASS